MNIIKELETNVDWNRVFGVVDSLYSDEGFTSNADNFARATMVEKAVDKFSNLNRVDKNGYDFTFQDYEKLLKIELKMKKGLFYTGRGYNHNSTKDFKVKSFLSEKKTLEDYRSEKTFDYLMVFDLTGRRVVIVEDELARSLYYKGADGAKMKLNEGDYYECNIGEINPILPPTKLSHFLEIAHQQFLNF